MEEEKKEKYKLHFSHELKKFTKELSRIVSNEKGEWTVKGFIDVYKNIYTISSDTKIISKVLEIHLFPQIFQFAEEIGYNIVFAEKQNWYPDLSFVNREDESIKFAVDLKTTYRDPLHAGHVNGFTLGSHGKYFKERTSVKNIQFAYSEYIGHFCLGIIYTRADLDDDYENQVYQVQELQEEGEQVHKAVGEREVTTVQNLKSISSVIKDFDFFVSEKWRIASDLEGSKNTANIGSITNIEDIKNGNGIFANLGEKWFDEYWMNYGTLTMIKNDNVVKIANLKDFLEFKGRKDLLEKIVIKTQKGKKSKK